MMMKIMALLLPMTEQENYVEDEKEDNNDPQEKVDDEK